MSNYNDREKCIVDLRHLLRNGDSCSLSTIEKVAELASYLDSHHKTNLNLTAVKKGRWIGSYDSEDDSDWNESHYISEEWGTRYKEGHLSREGQEIEFSKVLRLINFSEALRLVEDMS